MRRFFLGLAAMCCAGCSDDVSNNTQVPLAPVEDAGTRPAPAATGSSATREYDGVRVTVPADWVTIPLSDMQRGIIAARFSLDAIDPRVEVTLSSAGGGIQPNIDRWHGQFAGAAADEENLTLSGKECRLVELTGDFHPGFGKPNQTNWRMLGAAISNTPQDFYIKLTGPKDAVASAEPVFREFLQSVRFP